MTSFEINYPSAEEIRAITNNARQLRADAVRAAIIKAGSYFGRSIKRLGAIGVHHA